MLKKFNVNEVDKVAECLASGEIVAFPTDTVFGLACVFDNEQAVQRIKDAKGRDANKPLPMMCSSVMMINEVANIDTKAYKIMLNHFPGALTVILNKKDCVPAYVTNGFKTIAIRVPNYDLILRIIKRLGKPLLVTSANISNEPSIREYQEVINKLGDRIDAIVTEDAKSETSSTIVDLTDGFKIVRQGEISEEELLNTLNK